MGVEFIHRQDQDDKPILDQSQKTLNIEDLKKLPDLWAIEAVKRLSKKEQDLFLRQKLLAFCWTPKETFYSVAHAGALQEGNRRGFSSLGSISPHTYRKLVRRFFSQSVLHKAVHGLNLSKPWASAKRRLSLPQKTVFTFLALALLGWSLFFSVSDVSNLLQIAAGLFFLMVVMLRCLCVVPLPKGRGVVAPLLAEEDLPIYTVMIPLFRETTVLEQIIAAVSLLDYPAAKLDIKIILEENDRPMLLAVSELDLPWNFDVIVVPTGLPQTKPRALNYALQFARGRLLTIFDGEDIPQPNQLKLAAAQFASGSPELGCLQASLAFYNSTENWLTRQFTAEYAALFHVILPTLAAYRLPLPLGGTSNHFSVQALEAVGAWDAFNVTEDADLGFRLARHGYDIGILHSTTYEEANSELGNWMKQRRRWLKGFLQTWLVHMRNPLLLIKETSLSGFFAIQAMTLGVFVSALFHPFLLVFAVWNLLPEQVARQAEHPFSATMSGFSLALLLFGYVSAIATSKKGLRRIGGDGWWRTLLTIPGYWILTSVAAWMSLWDFIIAPFHWHKTRHGLSRMMRENRP
jgi:glycosyltransferase XagB